MSAPVRVLHVLGGLTRGGAESRIMDLYRHIDREKVQFDFLVHSGGKRGRKDSASLMANRAPQPYDEEIKRLGGRIYALPKPRVYNLFSYRRAAKRFFRSQFRKGEGFAVVQGHMTSTASLYLPAAKKAGVKITAAHARSAGVEGGLKGKITILMRRRLYRKTDFCLACSGEAGEAVFGKKRMEEGRVLLIPNAVELSKFAYDGERREEMRRRYQVEDRFVVGHVGRFGEAKNHEFLLDVFAALCGRYRKEGGTGEEPVLLLLGGSDESRKLENSGGESEQRGERRDSDGKQEKRGGRKKDGKSAGEQSREEAIRRRAVELGIANQVKFLGNRENPQDFYQMFDCFCFPSLYEGLPGTVIEAQACGLSCLVSDRVTREVGVTDLVTFFPLEEPASWASWLWEHRDDGHRERQGELRRAGFDAEELAGRMQSFYLTGDVDVLEQISRQYSSRPCL